MRSNKIEIDNRGNGFQEAVAETKKVAVFQGMNERQALKLQLIAEEMLSMVRSITGEMKATFWLENEGPLYELHMSTRTVLDRTMRDELIFASTSHRNEATKSFLGRLREAFENAMISDSASEASDEERPADVQIWGMEDQNWDGYERSVLRKLADHISISIRGGQVDMTIRKDFSK